MGQNLSRLGLALEAVGQCRLSVQSTTILKLSRFQGSYININGNIEIIPEAGVTITNASLANSTLYYVYAYMSAGTMTLELSATGHAAHTNGAEIKSGDPTRTLVGMVFTSGSGTFVDSGNSRTLANWFHRRPIVSLTTTVSGSTSSTGSFAEITTSGRAYVMCWGGESIDVVVVGSVNNSSASVTNATSPGLDGAPGGAQTSGVATGATNAMPAYGRWLFETTEGLHYGGAFGKVGGGTGTWTFGVQVTTWA